MKAGEVRKAAKRYSSEELAAGIEAITEEEEEVLEVGGEDAGERLTHLLLASRIRTRLDRGEEFKLAFRAVMGEVRGVLKNE